MAFTFPQGLAPELYPLAWLVGSWRGEGVLEYPRLETSGFVQEVTFDHDGGPYLRYESTIRLTPESMPEVPDQMAEFDKLDAKLAGDDAPELISDDSAHDPADPELVVWSTETGYWRIAPEPHQGVPAGQTSLEVLLSDPAGRVAVYLGAAGDGKVQLVSDLIARTGTAAEVTASKRMYGNVNGNLMWVQSLAAFGNPLQDYVSATLTRVEE
ncbi:FABP family protein [Timonella senegalensis]|uniref:FABP family protein n=1 Tax=Timonella senegalensis TaxID=1465825 RepID=UPI002FDCE0CB